MPEVSSPRRRTALGLGIVVAMLSSCGKTGATTHTAGASGAVAGSRYPFVLMHGFMGWDRAFYNDYFLGVPASLKGKGYAVFETHVSPLNSIEIRAKQAAAQIDAILAETGAEKVNLVAHSMGGLDARHLISVLGYEDRVASLSMVSTPNLGSPVADVAVGALTASSAVHAFIDKIFNGTSAIIAKTPSLQGYGPLDLTAALTNLSTDFAKNDFAPTHPDAPNVYYQSWAGHAPLNHHVPDILDPIVTVAYDYMKTVDGDNDGVVSVKSATYGDYRGLNPTDHLDEIGQLLGRQPPGFDRLGFYADILAELVTKGY